MNSKRSLFVVLLRVNLDMSDFLALAFRAFGIFLPTNNFVQRVNLLFSKQKFLGQGNSSSRLVDFVNQKSLVATSFLAKSRNTVNHFTGKFTGYLGCTRHDSSFVKWLLTFCATAKLPWLSRPDDGKQSVSFSAVVLLVS